MDNILSFGEILWDMLPDGKKLGGAPANFAYHCGQGGAAVRLVSQVGNDALGQEILEQCQNIGVSTELISRTAAYPTGTVLVQLGTNGLPSYTITENTAWDFIEASPAALQWAAQADALCFGSLAARSQQNRNTLQTLINAAPSACLRVADINLREPFCRPETIDWVLNAANVLKLNDEELVRLTQMYGNSALPLEEQLLQLRERFRFRLVVLTCGSKGSWLATEQEQVFTSGTDVAVADTVGAGDAFTAVAVLGFLQCKALSVIGRQANDVAAFVCSQSGGTPKIPPHLLARYGSR